MHSTASHLQQASAHPHSLNQSHDTLDEIAQFDDEIRIEESAATLTAGPRQLRRQQRDQGADVSAHAKRDDVTLPESSMDQSLSKEEYDLQRQAQIHQRRRLSIQYGTSSRVKYDGGESGSSSGSGSGPSAASHNAQNQNRAHHPSQTAQSLEVQLQNQRQKSNETTMAGMGSLSGRYSDGQEEVEVPSTSCVTTNSLSLSMQQDHVRPAPPHPPSPISHGKAKATEADVRRRPSKLSRSAQAAIDQDLQDNMDGTTSATISASSTITGAGVAGFPGAPGESVVELRTPGHCEEVELYLRTMIRARREGLLDCSYLHDASSLTTEGANAGMIEGPCPSCFVAKMPEPPKVFMTRWINYARYGVGWHLANGVIGVLCNDLMTLVLSPNETWV